MPTEKFHNLEIWQLGIALVKKIYLMTREFPDHELYTLTTQMRRSALSIPSNIAEGSRRNSYAEFIRFINIARGSLAELETQVIVVRELGYIREDIFQTLSEDIDHISRKTSNFSKKLTAILRPAPNA